MPEFISQHKEAIVALGTAFAAFTAVISLFVSAYALYTQRRFNRLSVKPIVRVGALDYAGKIEVHLRNYGAGTAICSSLTFRKKGKIIGFGSLVKTLLFEDRPSFWKDYSTVENGTPISIGGKRVLLRFDYDEADTNGVAQAAALRQHLSDIEVTCAYEDYFGSGDTVVRLLDWFKRDNCD